MAIKMSKKAKKSSQTKQNLGREKQTRIEILRTLAEESGLTRAQVETLFDSLSTLIQSHIRKRGSGEFTIPMSGIKVRRVKKKATKSRKMISPLTGQEVVIPGKPARNAVKISALKTLKTAVKE